MRKSCRNGFTMVELIVVLVIVGILAAVGIPAATRYIHLAEYRKNEENAKTAYLAAEAALTWYRSSGQWEEFCREVIDKGTPNNTFPDLPAAGGAAPARDERNGRIYAVRLGRDETPASGTEAALVMDLLGDAMYDGGFAGAALALEIDVRTGHVYSAFYGTRCDSLAYDGTDTDGVLNISAADGNRAPGSRKGRLLGYYSAEDLANVVRLKPVRLKVTTLSLVNSETLSLNWSSNSRFADQDVKYIVSFYDQGDPDDPGDDRKLFYTEISRGLMTGAQMGGSQTVPLTLKVPDGAGGGKDIGTWDFPLVWQSSGSSRGRFSLVLDGMMTAELLETLKADQENHTGPSAAALQYSTSITRLADADASLKALEAPLDLYATVEAQPDYSVLGEDYTEYTQSGEVRSNTENTLFAESRRETSGAQTIQKSVISRFRHLSNIRYGAPGQPAEYTVAAGTLGWTSAGVGMYTLAAGESGARSLVWSGSAQEGSVSDFPSVPVLPRRHTLRGEKGLLSEAVIANLKLGAASAPDDGLIDTLYASKTDAQRSTYYTRYLGLFCETEGSVEDLVLSDPELILTKDGGNARDGQRLQPAEQFGHLYGAGVLSGRNEGTLKNLAVRTSAKERQIVTVCLPDREKTENSPDSQPAGIGGLAGVLAGKGSQSGEEKLTALDRLAEKDASGALIRPRIENLSVEGAVTGILPAPKVQGASPEEKQEGAQKKTAEQFADGYAYGVGGIFGHAFLGDDSAPEGGIQIQVQIKDSANHAAVTGNLFTGGIAGSIRDAAVIGRTDGVSGELAAGVTGCRNDGLVLCREGYSHADTEYVLEGRYFGGILGYGSRVQVGDCYSASGRSKNYRYTYEQKERVLLGQYVGGILGYGSGSQLAGCRTEKDGYVLGSDYVGGIAGGLSNDAADAITGGGGVAVTTNAGYVIGNSSVGGIVGRNDGEARTTLTNCVNNGVAAGYGRYIGGIVGYNGENGYLYDCASYLSDFSGSLLNRIVTEWQAAGDCAGGLAGYNNGKIIFTEKSESITVKSVSSIVVGRDCVGGVVGFNDIKGELEVAYTLIGGQIHAYGNAAGGCIGLNASTAVLQKDLAIRPVSVEGNYYVGGCIGANVVDLVTRTRKETGTGTVEWEVSGPADITMDGLRTDNTLGRVAGGAFTGGVIGYQRTYTQGQLNTAAGEEIALRDYLERTAKHGGEAGENVPASMLPLLPGLDADYVPSPVLASGNPYTLFIENKNNTGSALTADNNNIPVFCDLYTGGVVGYCERVSALVLRNCRNSGRLSRRDESSDARQVSLKAYLGSQEVEADTSQLDGGDIKVSIGGGVIGANLDRQVIDHCENTGTMNGFIGLGGIVGFNAGGVLNCGLSDNFGSAALDYIGGIAGLNVRAGTKEGAAGGTQARGYTDVKGETWSDVRGLIAACETGRKSGVNWKTVDISGRRCVGGIVGYNLQGAVLEKNTNRANVTAAGDYAGGVAGVNGGEIRLAAADPAEEKQYELTVAGRNGQGVGGVAGRNRAEGTIRVTGQGSGTGISKEIIAVGANVSVVGREKAGGVVGVNEGTLETIGSGTGVCYLVCRAKQVRATLDCAGGVIGEARSGAQGGSHTISRAVNRAGRVTADNGRAGGIVAANAAGFTLSDCVNLGDVNSDSGYAGGIAAENRGQIVSCEVGDGGAWKAAKDITIRSRGADALGAVCAVNYNLIQNSRPVKGTETNAREVVLSGTAVLAGGVAGRNAVDAAGGTDGVIEMMGSDTAPAVGYMPKLDLSASDLTVGGVAGRNEQAQGGGRQAVIQNLTVQNLRFENFKNIRFLGGVAGENQGEIKGCTAEELTIQKNKATEKDAAGNCYGGVAGVNGAADAAGTIEGCTIRALTIDVPGVYTATATSTAAEKEAFATHVGGVAGRNEGTASQSSRIADCRIEAGSGNVQNKIAVDSGMAGGVAGSNKGRIERSGDEQACSLMKDGGGLDIQDAEPLINDAKTKENDRWVDWNNQSYSDGTGGVTDGRSLLLTVAVNGNLGGVTAYNGVNGAVSHCATGNWYLNNQSESIGVGTGGVIGMNESDRNQSFLYNQAFVGRELKSGITNRFAGGIIGNQNNLTGGGWSVSDSVNAGMVYCRNTHYAGGIIGQWTGSGGSVERCTNYGNLQTTYQTGWVGASAGIVAQLYHAYENHEYNIISCGNFGNIYGKDGKDFGGANDSAGILGNITAYNAPNTGSAQRYTINVTDCVNGAGVEIYSGSMASGIVGFFSGDELNETSIATSTANIVLNIDRCRNYAAVLKGAQFVAGIFGDRYGEAGSVNTTIKHCFSVNRGSGNYNKENNPVISYQNDNSKAGNINQGSGGVYNYFLSENTITSFRTDKDKDKWGNTANANLQRANAGWVYTITEGNTRYFLYLNVGTSSIQGITLTGKRPGEEIKNNQNRTIGKVLFTIPVTIPGSEDYGSMNDVVNGTVLSREFDEYVREFCYREAGRLLEPEKVVLSVLEKTAEPEPKGYRLQIEVDAPAYAGENVRYEAALYRKGADGQEEAIPLTSIALGEGGMEGDDGKTFTFDSQTFTLILSNEEAVKGGELYVKLKAVSDSGSSDEVPSNLVPFGSILPDPVLRAELVEQDGSYAYRFRLENPSDYAGYGTDLTVSVKLMGRTITFSADGSRTEPKLSGTLPQQALVQVSSENGAVSSGEVSVPVYLPGYTPEIAVVQRNNWNTIITQPAAAVTGTSLDDLRVSVTIAPVLRPASGTGVTTPPVYRAELIGTWRDADGKTYENTVFQSKDILTTANGDVTAVFTDLPSCIADAANAALAAGTAQPELKVRVWYAQSGLGPVYTESAEDGNNQTVTAANANIRTLTGTPGAGGAYDFTWKYGYTPVLNGDIFSNYRWISENLLTFLKAPVLMELPAGQKTLRPQTDGNGRLQYTFRWDAQENGGNTYQVSLKGVKDRDGNPITPVSIPIDENETPVSFEAGKGYFLTLDAEDWSYGEVELTVTRVGSGTLIGQTSVKRYPVMRRLAQPAQPRVSNPDVNELNYTVEWDPINPETGCERYGIFVQPCGDDGEPQGDPVQAGVMPVLDGDGQPGAVNGVYETAVSLEEYAGQRVLIYLKAQPADGSEDYVHSVDGVTYSLQVPERIPAPEVEWNHNWKHETTDGGEKVSVLTVEDFEGGGLIAGLEAQADGTNTGIPPGGSAYLLKGCVFKFAVDVPADERQELAQKAAEIVTKGLADEEEKEELALLAGLTLAARYPAPEESGGWSPAQMDVGESASEYRHGLLELSAEHAGQYVLFFARISSGEGKVSSPWVYSDLWQLPYVKLSAPETLADSRDYDRKVTLVYNPDLTDPGGSVSGGNLDSVWTAAHTVLTWDSVDYADTYEFTLTAEPEEGAPSGSEETQSFRVREAPDGTLTVAWKNAAGGYEPIEPTEGGDGRYELTQYRRKIDGRYELDADYTVPYEVELTAELQIEALPEDEGGFRCTLILPDVSRLTPQDESVGTNSITDRKLRFTKKVEIVSDVEENETPPESEAYVCSDVCEIKFEN